MEATEPLGQVVATAGIWLVGFQSGPEVLCTLITGKELGEEGDKLAHLLLLGGGGMIREICCHRVQERPGVSA